MFGMPSDAEALRPIVPTAGLGGVDQFERSAAIRRGALLVEVDGDIRNQRLPTELQQQRRVVKRTGGGIHDMASDTAVFARREGLLAELQEWFWPRKPCQP